MSKFPVDAPVRKVINALEQLGFEKIREGNHIARWAAFGKTDTERFLVVIFTRRNNLMRIISARDMNKRERKFYDEKG